ncbi:MAG: hypothetical protein SFV19_16845 [Rhodospirillaceae bacterium]|nr:hypothetical protein [Rhodospirillaceae bacterium]
MNWRAISLVTAVMALPTAADATSNVSAKYDGTYAGVMSPVAALSLGTCAIVTVETLTIAGGFLREAKTGGVVALSGFVTEEGFVAGKARFGGASAVTFEGRIEGTSLSGGIIEDAIRCAWTVNLTRR